MKIRWPFMLRRTHEAALETKERELKDVHAEALRSQRQSHAERELALRKSTDEQKAILAELIKKATKITVEPDKQDPFKYAVTVFFSHEMVWAMLEHGDMRGIDYIADAVGHNVRAHMKDINFLRINDVRKVSGDPAAWFINPGPERR